MHHLLWFHKWCIPFIKQTTGIKKCMYITMAMRLRLSTKHKLVKEVLKPTFSGLQKKLYKHKVSCFPRAEWIAERTCISHTKSPEFCICLLDLMQALHHYHLSMPLFPEMHVQNSQSNILKLTPLETKFRIKHDICLITTCLRSFTCEGFIPK